MEGSLNLTGHIIAMPPRGNEPDNIFSRSVVLVVSHKKEGSWGIIVNKQNPRVGLSLVMQSAGIDHVHDETTFVGGPVEQQRVYVVHTLDWRSHSTVSITPEIGVTGDISILAAINQGEGPKLYRACIGIAGWAPGQLDGEYKGLPPWDLKRSWLDAPATVDAVFNSTGNEQWEQAIDIIAKSKVSNWL